MAPDELVPDSPPDKAGPPLGPGTPSGKRPIETPKDDATPPGKKVGLPAAKPGAPPQLDGKKERIATDIKQKGKPPSGKPFA